MITRCRVCDATLQVWAGSEPEELREVCGSCATAELRRLAKRVAELEGALGSLRPQVAILRGLANALHGGDAVTSARSAAARSASHAIFQALKGGT